MENLVNTAVALVTAYGLNVVGGIAILILGWVVARWIGRVLRRALNRWNRIDPMLVNVFATLARYGVMLFTILAVLNQFGVQTTSVIALLGAAGLAFGLAIQGTLSHLAAGVMLLLFRPFRIGDWINAGGTVGRVDDVQLFTTTLASPDNVRIIMPNGKIWGEVIQNYTQSPTRRIDTIIGIDYADDVDKALAAALAVAQADKRVLADPAPEVHVDALAESSVNILVRVWSTGDDYWPVRFGIAKALKQRFDREGITIPFPQRVLHVSDDSLERLAAVRAAARPDAALGESPRPAP